MPVIHHAKIAPSGLDRYTKCPASPKASEGYASSSSNASRIGSVAVSYTHLTLPTSPKV